MKLKKWTYELIIVVVLLCIGLGVWWFVATKDVRQAEAEFEQLVKFANRQAVEIAVIKQSAELQQLTQAIVMAQQKAQQETRRVLEQVVQPPTAPE